MWDKRKVAPTQISIRDWKKIYRVRMQIPHVCIKCDHYTWRVKSCISSAFNLPNTTYVLALEISWNWGKPHVPFPCGPEISCCRFFFFSCFSQCYFHEKRGETVTFRSFLKKSKHASSHYLENKKINRKKTKGKTHPKKQMGVPLTDGPSHPYHL